MAETNALQKILVTLGDMPLNVNVNIPGIKGDNGQDGINGADGLSAYDIAQLNGFTGTQQEWLESLKAGSVADEARTMLLNGNVWCKSNSIADVLAAVISNLGKAFPRTEFKPLTVPTVLRGQRVVTVEGEPHYSVKVAGMETPFEIGDNGTCSISIEPLGVDDVKLTYHNFTSDKVGDYTIRGVADETAVQPDETFEEYGAKYSKYGRKLVINVTNFTGYNPIKMLGKWLVSEIDSILIKTNIKVNVATGDGTFKDKRNNPIGNIPIIVETPKKVTFANGDNNPNPIKLGDVQHGVSDVRFNSSNIEWSDHYNKYISNGSAVDHL